MKTVRFVACSLAAATVSSCVVGPNYRPPAPPVGAGAAWSSLRPDAESATPARDDWWRLYDDPALDRYVREARTANDDLAAAEANLSAARAILEAARGRQYPQAGAAASGVLGRDPTTDEILELTGRPPTTVWLFDSVLDASYEIDLFGHVKRRVEAARDEAQAVAAGRDSLVITVAAETARAYAEICAYGEQLDVARQDLETVRREADIATARRKAGAGSEFEEVRAQTLVAQVRSAIPPLEGRRRAALFQLAALLGRTPARAPVEAMACARPPKLSVLAPVGDGAALLRRRPDLREAERRLAGATARVGVATAELYPRISLTGFYGGASSEFSALTAERGLAWGFGPSIQWDLPGQTVPRARVRQAKAGARAALAAFDSTVLRALKETEQALSVYDSELDHQRALLEAQAKTSKTYDLAHGQFLAGAASQLDLLTAEQSLTSADAAVAASDAAVVEDQISLFKALGGGWATPTGLASRPETPLWPSASLGSRPGPATGKGP